MKAETRKHSTRGTDLNTDFEVDHFDDTNEPIDSDFIEDVYNEVNQIRSPIPGMDDSGSFAVDDDEAFDNWLKRGRIVKYLSYQ